MHDGSSNGGNGNGRRVPWVLVIIQTLVSVLVGIIFAMVTQNSTRLDNMSNSIQSFREQQIVNTESLKELKGRQDSANRRIDRLEGKSR